MKKSLSIYALVCLFACNQTDQHTKRTENSKKNNSATEYPLEIRNKHLESFYDKTKWLIYCIHCDEHCRFYKKLNVIDSPFFGSLDLKFDRAEFFNDTTELNFYFYYKDTIKCDVNTVYNYGSLTYGAAFKDNNDSVIYFL